MHARRLGLLGAWILTLALLAWAAAPSASTPSAPAWDATTFPSRLAGRGEQRFEAREGGYAALFTPSASGYRARADGGESSGTPYVRRVGDYVDAAP